MITETGVGQRVEIRMDEHNVMFAPFLNRSGILADVVKLVGSDHYVLRLDKTVELDGLQLESLIVTPNTGFEKLKTGWLYFVLVVVPSTWLTAMGYSGNNLANGIAADMKLVGE